MWSPNFFPSLLGASCSIAFSAVSGTALFNFLAWLKAGSGLSFSEAYSAVPANSFYIAASIALTIIAGALGGIVAAKLSTRQPYLNALISALFVLIWSVVLFASPLAE